MSVSFRKKSHATFTCHLFNSFTAKVALMHPKIIVQSKLRRRIAKAASELGLHYFGFIYPKHISLQILLIYYILSFQKLGIILNKKVHVVPNDNFKCGSERAKQVFKSLVYKHLRMRKRNVMGEFM